PTQTAREMVGVADGSRNTPTDSMAVRTTGSTQAAAAEGETGDAGRKPKTSSRESVENDSTNGTHTRCFHCCHGGHAASLSDQAAILELCGLGGRHPHELGIRNERSEEHTSELQSPDHLVCRLLLEKKKKKSLNTI